MKINRKTHLQIGLQNWTFMVLFLVVAGLLGWLSTRYTAQFDWTANGQNTLSEASRKVLDMLKGPVKVTAYAREEEQQRTRIRDRVNRYSRYKNDVTLEFVNPDTNPAKIRDLGITVDGELIVEFNGRTEKLQEPEENALTNALQRLAHAQERQVVFLEGHGERTPSGQANFDLGQFGEELKRKGFNVAQVSLAVTSDIPHNTSVLVVAGPQSKLLPGEVTALESYLKRGGNLLWLAEPGGLSGMDSIAKQLGLSFVPGTVVDATTQLFGINDPTFALVTEYGAHPITYSFKSMTLFPGAAAVESAEGGEFQATPLLSTLARSWTETGPLEGKIAYDEGKEKQGPLTIGYVLTRDVKLPSALPKPDAGKTDANGKPAKDKATGKAAGKPEAANSGKPEAGASGDAAKPPEAPASVQQRIAVFGDADFLSNSYLGNGGNLDLGLNLFQWLSQADELINIPAKAAVDKQLQLSPVAQGLIALVFLALLPLSLLATGGIIWFQRRSR